MRYHTQGDPSNFPKQNPLLSNTQNDLQIKTKTGATNKTILLNAKK